MDLPASGTHRATGSLAATALLLCFVFLLVGDTVAIGQTPDWRTPLSSMQIPAETPPITRTNAIRILLSQFRSNDVVRAIVVLPGVVDDFHLIHRDAPALDIRAGNLADAITQLTQRTDMRVTFADPILLLHTPEEPARHPASYLRSSDRSKLAALRNTGELLWIDTHWERAQPHLRKRLGRAVRPEAGSREAWHFERLNLAAFQLTTAELISAVSLATKTRATVTSRRVTFELATPR